MSDKEPKLKVIEVDFKKTERQNISNNITALLKEIVKLSEEHNAVACAVSVINDDNSVIDGFVCESKIYVLAGAVSHLHNQILNQITENMYE